MKTCSKCKLEKELSEFNKQKTSKDGLQHYCKRCKAALRAIWRSKNTIKANEETAAWKKKNKSRVKECEKKWVIANRGLKNSINKKRQASKIQRTVKWADFEKIKAYYDVCAFFNEVNGYTKYNVDHIIPLQGKNVSGLHVHTNLQIILAVDNFIKGNRYNG